ncbi:MAG: hypothetical protein JOZ69_14935 [Myxococcales bacterium]|nr:hypothetical protein [Myxococcales bacterium]
MPATGHDDMATTQRYINEAQTFEPEPFPAVPSFGLGFGVSAAPSLRSPYFSRAEERPQGDSNPR